MHACEIGEGSWNAGIGEGWRAAGAGACMWKNSYCNKVYWPDETWQLHGCAVRKMRKGWLWRVVAGSCREGPWCWLMGHWAKFGLIWWTEEQGNGPQLGHWLSLNFRPIGWA